MVEMQKEIAMNRFKMCLFLTWVFFVVALGDAHAVDSVRTLPRGNARLKAIGAVFAETLNKMSNTRFALADSPFDGRGILLALAKDYKGKVAIPAEIADNMEAFAVSADSKSIVILGNSPKAVQDGMYTYLGRLGCRWFFPGKRWTIIPKVKSVYENMSFSSAPDYANRNIWYQYGFGWGKRWSADKIRNDYLKWRDANRQGGKDANCGHSWGHIVHRNKAAFDAHPEFYAMGKDGNRIIPKNPNAAKFCCSNPELIRLVAEDRLRLLREKRKRNPDAFMVSVDPSDGPHMCHCAACAKLGGGRPSDMVVNLANGVARYLREREPGAWVGFYAYSAHQYPPELPIEKNVYVQIATAFNSTKYSLDELIKIWGSKAGAVGIREYYSCMAWNKNLPGRARGADVEYHKRVIPKWFKYGATSISAESNDNWAAQGLGYYVAANLMWNTKTDVDALVDDFYAKAFGKAAPPIRELYAMWKDAPPLLPAYLARWLEKLDEASKLTRDPAVLARINDLKAYLHYVVLYSDFERAKAGDDARAKYLELMEFAFRIKSRNVIHSYALARRIANGVFPASVLKDLPKELRGKNKRAIDPWNVFNYKTCPWQQNPNEYADGEIETFFQKDLRRLAPRKNDVRFYSHDLIPPPMPLEGAADGDCRQNTYRFKTIFYFLAGDEDAEVLFKGVRMSNFTLFDPTNGNELQKELVRPGKERKIRLKTERPGLYKLVANGWYTLKFPKDLKVVYEMSSLRHGQPTAYAGPGYFFVPKGRRSFRMAIGARLIVKDPNGNIHKYIPEKDPRTVEIEVPEGCDGKRWEICFLTCGRWYFLDLPPFVSLSPDGYIGPKECF